MAERAPVESHALMPHAFTTLQRSMRRVLYLSVTAVGLLVAASDALLAQESCRVLCSPELKIEPTFTIESLFDPPLVETRERNRVVASERERRERVFELIFALDVPTVVPRVGLTFEAIFKPFGSTDTNPFTGTSASELGRADIRDNGVEIESELNFHLIDEEQTGGWISSHVDVVDQFSPAHRPGDASVFTHKLDFEWDTAFHLFTRLPAERWLRDVEFEVSLDYLATGLPKAGDVLGDERFIDSASPWSLSFVLVVPLAPLVP